MNYEVATYLLTYALIVVVVWAIYVHGQNSQLKRELDSTRKACNDLKVFTHTLHYGPRK